MIHINKQEEPSEILEWKRKFKNKNKRNANYDDITKDCKLINGKQTAKEVLKEKLIGEQLGICCYCCNQISHADSHIEHFRPKGREEYKTLTLSYENLHASCQGIYHSMDTCGHNKHGDFDEQLMISPLEEDCESHFTYNEFGEISAKNNDKRADYTIQVLNLDDERLVKAREIAIQCSGVLDAVSEEDRELYQEIYRTVDQNGNLPQFCDAILYLAAN